MLRYGLLVVHRSAVNAYAAHFHPACSYARVLVCVWPSLTLFTICLPHRCHYFQYHKRRFQRKLDLPTGAAPDGSGYAAEVRANELAREKEVLQRQLERQQEEEARVAAAAGPAKAAGKKRSRWGTADADADGAPPASRWEETPVVSSGAGGSARASRWGETPVDAAAGSSRWGETPAAAATGSSRWGETPAAAATGSSRWGETPAAATTGSSRWGETPMAAAGAAAAEAMLQASATSSVAATPVVGMTPALTRALRQEQELARRNRPLTDDELDEMLPSQGYIICAPPAGYAPPESRRAAGGPSGFSMAETPVMSGSALADAALPAVVRPGGVDADLPYLKPQDEAFFACLRNATPDDELTPAELTERDIAMQLLRLKNGDARQRRVGLRTIVKKAREYGADALLHQLLPLLMSPGLEDTERHTLVKVISRVLFKLQDQIAPATKSILTVVQPMLIDAEYYARVEGREVVSNLAKAVGLAPMVVACRAGIDSVDEHERNVTARTFAVVASALGIPVLLPFIAAAASSSKSWQARHTGIKIIQRIGILMGCAVLPHLTLLVNIVTPGLSDDNMKVQAISALSIAALAEAACPYGFESFDSALKPLWIGVTRHSGKTLAAFVKAVGCVIPLMNAEYSKHFIEQIMPALLNHFHSSDEEMKRTILKVLQQCCAAEGMEASFLREHVLEKYFTCFWEPRSTSDRRTAQLLQATTLALANKTGGADILGPLAQHLKDHNVEHRIAAVRTVCDVVQEHGLGDVHAELEQALMDGILIAFQEYREPNPPHQRAILACFGAIMRALDTRGLPYISQILGTIKHQVGVDAPAAREIAALLVVEVAEPVVHCGQQELLANISTVLYENLGAGVPEVLAALLAGLTAVLRALGVARMTPAVGDLLPRLVPILKNKADVVAGTCVELVGLIADVGAKQVHKKEWMRVCFDLLQLLKSEKKTVRRATMNAFGYIAKAIGPQEVIYTLLNNLRVQERQLRVCTTIAIAIVADTCGAFTILPAVLNEYRTADLNVQNGVLKTLAYLYQYIGRKGAVYVPSTVTLLACALSDRDAVHRQLACQVVGHAALGASGQGLERELVHLLNFVWPNIFETTPYVLRCVFEAIEGLRVALGPGRIFLYVLQGLFHPARRVREAYWKLYNNLYCYAGHALPRYFPNLAALDEYVQLSASESLAKVKHTSTDALLASALQSQGIVMEEGEEQDVKSNHAKLAGYAGQEEQEDDMQSSDEAVQPTYAFTYMQLIV